MIFCLRGMTSQPPCDRDRTNKTFTSRAKWVALYYTWFWHLRSLPVQSPASPAVNPTQLLYAWPTKCGCTNSTATQCSTLTPPTHKHTHTPPWAVYTSTITSSLPTTCRRLVVHTVRTSRRQNRVQLMQRPNTHHRLVVTGPISGVTVSRSLRRGTGGPG